MNTLPGGQTGEHVFVPITAEQAQAAYEIENEGIPRLSQELGVSALNTNVIHIGVVEKQDSNGVATIEYIDLNPDDFGMNLSQSDELHQHYQEMQNEGFTRAAIENGSIHVEVSEKDTTRAQRIFSPPVAKKSDSQQRSYDSLFDSEAGTRFSVEDAAVRSGEGRSVTEQSVAEAKSMLQQALLADKDLKGIIESTTGKSAADETIVDELRTNPDLRVAVGQHFIERIKDLYQIMPERVRRNSQKNPGSKGYEDMPSVLSSREYAALMALSMIDGTFNAARADTETYDFTTDSGVGQHRYAARQVLTARR